METVNYSMKTPEGELMIKLPKKQMEILKGLESAGKTQRELLKQSKEIYAQKYPQEAKMFYRDKL